MTFTSRLESFLTGANHRVVRHARRFRTIYVLIAAAIFVGGVVASVWTLDLDWQQLKMRWLLLNLLVGAPFAIGLNAVGLMLSAHVIGASLSFRTAFHTCCVAICTNLLPIPAGSVVHASSLVSGGGSVMQSGAIVVVGNILSLALVMALVGTILVFSTSVAGLLILATGVAGLIAGTAYVLTRTTVRMGSAFLAIRVLRTLVTVFRIQLSFLVIGLIVGILDAALFSGAVILGSTLAVIPAGLGISEAIAAMISIATTIAPGAAFLAVALNRLVTLAFCSLFIMTSPGRGMDRYGDK